MLSCVESIWNEFNKPLKSFIKKHVHRDQDAEDILQDVFYKILKHMKDLNETEKLYAWVYRITKNAIADFYRAQKETVCIEDLPDEIFSEDKDEVNVNDEIGQCLVAMIEHLSDKYKEAIVLTEFKNLTQKEMADRMGLSVSGAKSRVQRARMKLKVMLLDCCQLDFDRLGNVVDYKHKCENCKFC